MKLFFYISFLTFILFGCDEGFDMDKYKNYKDNDELYETVHEWVGDYVSRYCRANIDGSITCR